MQHLVQHRVGQPGAVLTRANVDCVARNITILAQSVGNVRGDLDNGEIERANLDRIGK